MQNITFEDFDPLQKAASCFGIFHGFPARTPSRAVPDGPLLGNGDLGIVVGCDEQTLRFYLSKNDFWCAAPQQLGGGIKSLGVLELKLGTVKDLTFYAEQHILHGEVIITLQFQNEGGVNQLLKIRSYVPYQENMLLIEAECLDGSPAICVDLVPMPDPNADFSHELRDGRISISKSYHTEGLLWETLAHAGCRILDHDSSSFRMARGETVIIAACAATSHDTPEYIRAVEDALTQDFTALLPDCWAAHTQWWDAYWQSSGVSLPSHPEIERYWYGSQYILACCCRAGKFAPGIFGNWITTEAPNWAGDYHLNYNYQAPWWGCFSSNRICLAEPYDRPLLEYLPTARKNASEQLNCRGIYAKVGIGPKGLETAIGIRPDGSRDEFSAYWGQKSNAAYAALNMSMRFYSTYDREYARDCAYPFLLETAAFWEDYLTLENGRYVIYNDCIHENPASGLGVYDWVGPRPDDYSDDFNPILTLGLLRVLFKSLIDMSESLDADSQRREKWEDILAHLSSFPTQVRNGKTVFRYTEKGMDWCDGNSLGIQHIFPCGCIGLSSPPALLQIARDTLEMMGRWQDYNAFPTFYTAAARIGYDPDTLLNNMQREIASHGFPNFFIYYGGGGIECCSTVPGCINEMLVQSYEGVLRFFPVWKKEQDAQFYHLRCHGAFLVSGSIHGGEISPIELYSEKGRPCQVLCPWKEGMMVYSGDSEVMCRKVKDGDQMVYQFNTMADTGYVLQPDVDNHL